MYLFYIEDQSDQLYDKPTFGDNCAQKLLLNIYIKNKPLYIVYVLSQTEELRYRNQLMPGHTEKHKKEKPLI